MAGLPIRPADSEFPFARGTDTPRFTWTVARMAGSRNLANQEEWASLAITQPLRIADALYRMREARHRFYKGEPISVLFVCHDYFACSRRPATREIELYDIARLQVAGLLGHKAVLLFRVRLTAYIRLGAACAGLTTWG